MCFLKVLFADYVTLSYLASPSILRGEDKPFSSLKVSESSKSLKRHQLPSIHCCFRKNKWKICCCCSVTKSSPTFCDPMDSSMPGLPDPHHLPVFTQVHVHWIGDTIQPSQLPLLYLIRQLLIANLQYPRYCYSSTCQKQYQQLEGSVSLGRPSVQAEFPSIHPLPLLVYPF